MPVFPQFELRFIYFSSYRKSSHGFKLVRWSGLKRICECNQNCGVRLRWRWWIESCSTEDNDRGDVKVVTIKVLKRNSFLLWLFKSCISGLKLCLIIWILSRDFFEPSIEDIERLIIAGRVKIFRDLVESVFKKFKYNGSFKLSFNTASPSVNVYTV